jgi:hypothetical protein
MSSVTEQCNTWAISTLEPLQTIYGGTGVSAPLGTTYAINGGSGTAAVTIAATSGATGVTAGAVQLYEAVSTVTGNVVNIQGTFTYTATSTTPVFTITVPFTGNFLNGNQATGIATVSKSTSPAIGDGIVPTGTIVSVSASKNIQLSPVTTDNSSAYRVGFNIAYILN